VPEKQDYCAAGDEARKELLEEERKNNKKLK
jgi:hypothetical protein